VRARESCEGIELVVWPCPHERLGVTRGDDAATLPFQRSGDDGRAAAPGTRVDDFVDERHEIVG
jgi:hypothetical protein